MNLNPILTLNYIFTTGSVFAYQHTFTKNLALDIYENLKLICTEDILSRIEVRNLDSWVYDFLKKNGYINDIVYEKNTDKIWENALVCKDQELNVPDSFFKEEWDRVIQPQSISTVDEYVKASRLGRGTKLTRIQRKLIWSVFELDFRTFKNFQTVSIFQY